MLAGAAAGADNQRDFGGDGGAQHEAEVAANRNRGAERLARPQIMRAWIDAAAIDTDHVGETIHAGFEGGFGEAIAKDGGGREQPDFLAHG